MQNVLHRVVLVSDMHYTTEETPEEMRRINPAVNVSFAAGDAFGYTQKQKVDSITADIKELGKEIEAVLVLGDLSIDDYGFRNIPDNYCLKFKKDCMEKLSCPAYAIPGNHDSYPNEMWREIFGYDRQFSVKIGDAAFIMLDTFNSAPAHDASGSAFTDVDIDFLKAELEKYPTEKIFLCAHYIRTKGNEKLAEVIRHNDRIICLFRGHTHINKVIQPESLCGKYLVDIGGYGYNGECVDGRWIFTKFKAAWAWGYEILEWNEAEVRMYHVKPKRKYRGCNGEFDYPGAVEDLCVISGDCS